MALLDKTNPSDTWVDDVLSLLSHHAAWSLWLTTKKRAHTSMDAPAPALVHHMMARRPHLYAHPKLIDGVLATGSVVSASEAAQMLLEATTEGEQPWRTQDTTALLGFVRHIAHGPHVVSGERKSSLRRLWNTLLEERSHADHPDLVAATHALWDIRVPDDPLQKVWVNMVMRVGHTPALLEGFMHHAASAANRRAALHAIRVSPPNPPVDISIFKVLSQDATQQELIELLDSVSGAANNGPAWTSAVLELLWARAGLNTPTIRTSTMWYCSIMCGLADKGMITEFTHRLTSGRPIDQAESEEVVKSLGRVPNEHSGAALRAVLGHAPPTDRALLLTTFVANSDLFGDDDTCALAHDAVVVVWDLLPPQDATSMLNDHPNLAQIPQLAAWAQHSLLAACVDQHQATRAPLKM